MTLSKCQNLFIVQYRAGARDYRALGHTLATPLPPTAPVGILTLSGPDNFNLHFDSFYFPDRESTVIVKKINVEIFTNLHVLRSKESEKKVFKKMSWVLCTLPAVTVAGDEGTGGIKTKLLI